MIEETPSATSEQLRKIVTCARNRQRLRYGANYTNAIVPIKLFEEKVSFNAAQLERIESESFRENLSSRSTLKVLRLARTITDVMDEETVSDMALDEALKWKISAATMQSSLLR
ncbi:hypothetical protein [Planococcus maitriensis]|uniref:Mg chelatase-related protein C-terminal domain-containing protein n=1 Tax=Planococcus maitriensis TaxID=221799 RepID=A0A365KA48_9BACL|nr:hypothetical protein [Planococcus maitriensis]RAZ69642.1 hypothetical protein DP119_03010 [Planococcus maitriensis]